MNEYRIQFREWSYAKCLYNSFFDHLKNWCFGIWNKVNCCGIWEDSGFRIFGIEFCKRKWLKCRNNQYESK